jgi:hypothetical protein
MIPWSLMALLTLLAVAGAVTVLLRWRLAGPGPSGTAAPSPGPAVPISPYGSAATPSKQAGLAPAVSKGGAVRRGCQSPRSQTTRPSKSPAGSAR